jgi:transcriptional regulator with XRE-family HTH domain
MAKNQKAAEPVGADDQPELRSGTISAGADIGGRIRRARERQGISLRRLAAQTHISPSGLSQIETGRSRPSVRTLYAIVSELDISLDDLFARDAIMEPAFVEAVTRESGAAKSVGSGSVPGPEPGMVQWAGERKVIELESGVVWERLNPPGEQDVEFLSVTYAPGGASSGTDTFVRHAGREYGLVLSGVLQVAVGFQDFELGAGDSISFESSIPHRLVNAGDVPVSAVWFVIGRQGSDQRAQWSTAG